MATLYLVAAGGNISAANTWDSVSGGVGGDGPPGAGDTIVCDAASGAAVLVIDAPYTVAGLNTSGGYGTGLFGGTINFANPLTITDDATFRKFTAIGAGSNILAGGTSSFLGGSALPLTTTDWSGFVGTVIFNAAAGAPTWEVFDDLGLMTLPNVEINNAGVGGFMYSGSYPLRCGNLTITAGKLDMNNKGAYLTGNLTTTAGTWTTIDDPTDFDRRIHFIGATTHAVSMAQAVGVIGEIYIGTGSTVALGANQAYASKLSGPGSLTGTTGVFHVTDNAVGGSDNFFGFNAAPVPEAWTGTLACHVSVEDTITSPGGNIYPATDKNVTIQSSSAHAMVWDGRIHCLGAGTITVQGTGAGDIMTVDVAGGNWRTGPTGKLQLGTSAANTGSGIVDLGCGLHKVGSGGIVRGNAANAANALDFGSSTVECVATGTVDGTGITCTNTLGVVSGGTVSNVDLTGQPVLLHIYPVGGAGNVNVTQLASLMRAQPFASVNVA